MLLSREPKARYRPSGENLMHSMTSAPSLWMEINWRVVASKTIHRPTVVVLMMMMLPSGEKDAACALSPMSLLQTTRCAIESHR